MKKLRCMEIYHIFISFILSKAHFVFLQQLQTYKTSFIYKAPLVFLLMVMIIWLMFIIFVVKLLSPSMNSLKLALSTDEGKTNVRDKGEVNGSLLKGVNRSKAEGLWALDVDSCDRVTEESLNTDGLLRVLNDLLDSAFKKDSKNITEVYLYQIKVTFQRIIEEFQDAAGGSKNQLTYLMVMQDKLTDIFEFAKVDFKKFLDLFNQMLEAKIIKMRKRQKKVELNNFDNIVNCNFKKKNDDKVYLVVEADRPLGKSRERRQKSSKSSRKASKSNSNDNKLNRLFSKEKDPLKERELKESAKKGEDEGAFNATTNLNHDESVSFSTVLSTNVTVKTRKRKNSPQGKKQKPKKSQEKAGDPQEVDEGFMFFRPKNKKKG